MVTITINDAIHYAIISSSCHFLPLGPNILLISLFSSSLRICSFLSARDQVSCPYKTAGKGTVLYILILGAFAKLRKATISFVMFVCPSVCQSIRIEQLGSYCTGFHEIWYLSIFRKSVEKIRVSLKSAKNNGTAIEDQYTFLIQCRSVLLRMRKNFQT